jgi:hypothetical protein
MANKLHTVSKLLPEESVRNPKAGEIWKRSEVDKMLTHYYDEEMSIVRIAVKHGRDPYAIEKKLDEYVYNERNRLVNYRPLNRLSRIGKPLNKREKKLIRTCIKQGINLEHAARMLMRKVSEVSTEDIKHVLEGKHVAATLDLVMAYRHIYHNYKFKIISNDTYDDLKGEEEEFGGGARALASKECPPYIKTLALYLVEKYEWEHGSKPPGRKK